MDQKKGLYLKIRADFHEFWGEDKKKALHLKKCANFHEVRGETTKKKIFITKSAKKIGLAHEFWGNNQYLGSLRLRTALQWHRTCYFLWGTILAWEAQFSLGGASSDLGGHGPGMPPVASGLLQVYSNLSNCQMVERYHIHLWSGRSEVEISSR